MWRVQINCRRYRNNIFNTRRLNVLPYGPNGPQYISMVAVSMKYCKFTLDRVRFMFLWWVRYRFVHWAAYTGKKMIDCKWLGWACVKKERESEIENRANPATLTPRKIWIFVCFFTSWLSTYILWRNEEQVFLYEFAFVYHTFSTTIGYQI